MTSRAPGSTGIYLITPDISIGNSVSIGFLFQKLTVTELEFILDNLPVLLSTGTLQSYLDSCVKLLNNYTCSLGEDPGANTWNCNVMGLLHRLDADSQQMELTENKSNTTKEAGKHGSAQLQCLHCRAGVAELPGSGRVPKQQQILPSSAPHTPQGRACQLIE